MDTASIDRFINDSRPNRKLVIFFISISRGVRYLHMKRKRGHLVFFFVYLDFFFHQVLSHDALSRTSFLIWVFLFGHTVGVYFAYITHWPFRAHCILQKWTTRIKLHRYIPSLIRCDNWKYESCSYLWTMVLSFRNSNQQLKMAEGSPTGHLLNRKK